MKLFEQTMAHSDTEDVYEPGESGIKQTGVAGNLLENEAYEKNIHSGHFMVSHVHEVAETDQEENILYIAGSENSNESGDSYGNAEDNGELNNKLTSIDSSLSKLFKCMSIVERYLSNRGTLTSPKWKNFRGIKVRLKEKIRLNNIIWREWHMQFVKGAHCVVCHFSSPLAENIQYKTSYNRIHWKRQWIELRDHWKKMSHFSKNKFFNKHQNVDCLSENKPYCEIIQRSSENNSRRLTSLGGIVNKAIFNDPDMEYDADFTFHNLLFDAGNLKEVSAFSEDNFYADNNFNEFFDHVQSSFKNDTHFQKSPLVFTEIDQENSNQNESNIPLYQGNFNLPHSHLDQYNTAINDLNVLNDTSLSSHKNLDDDFNTYVTKKINHESIDIVKTNNISNNNNNDDFLFESIANNTRFNNLENNNISQSNEFNNLTVFDNGGSSNVFNNDSCNNNSKHNDRILAENSETLTNINVQSFFNQDSKETLFIKNVQDIYNSNQQNVYFLYKHLQENNLPKINQQHDSIVLLNQEGFSSQCADDVISQQRSPMFNPQVIQSFQQNQQHPQNSWESSVNQLFMLDEQSNIYKILVLSNNECKNLDVNNEYKNSVFNNNSVSQNNENEINFSSKNNETFNIHNMNLIEKNDLNLQSNQNKKVSFLSEFSTSSTNTNVVSSGEQDQYKSDVVCHNMPLLTSLLKQSQQPPVFHNQETQQFFQGTQTIAFNNESNQHHFKRTNQECTYPKHETSIVDQPANQLIELIQQSNNNFSITQHASNDDSNKKGFIMLQLPADFQLMKTDQFNAKAQETYDKEIVLIQPDIQHTSLQDNHQSINLETSPPLPHTSIDEPSFKVPQPLGKSRQKNNHSNNNEEYSLHRRVFDMKNYIQDPSSCTVMKKNVKIKTTRKTKPRVRKVKEDIMDDEDEVPKDTSYHANSKISSHKNIEQMRRFSIKCGLDNLNEVVPAIRDNNGCRISKTTTLTKTVNYIKKLKDERDSMEEELDRLKMDKKQCEQEIKMYQSQLPASGMPSKTCLISPACQQQLEAWIKQFVFQKARSNTKFWIFLLLIEPLFSSLQNLLNSTHSDNLTKKFSNWLNESCSLISLRPMISDSLRLLCTSSCLLTDPDGFKGQMRSSIEKAIATDTLSLKQSDGCYLTQNSNSPLYAYEDYGTPKHIDMSRQNSPPRSTRSSFSVDSGVDVPSNQAPWHLS